MPVEPVLNHIKTYATDTYEREDQSQQNLEVEEGIMNIKLINLPITRDCNGEH